MANDRINTVNKETVEQYYGLLKEVLEESGLMNSPAQIYNVDESGKSANSERDRTKRHQESAVSYLWPKRDKSPLLAVPVLPARSFRCSLFFIQKRFSSSGQWETFQVQRTYGLSSKGWIDSELFEGWLSNHFIPPHVVSARPLLLLDGHSTHYCPEVLCIAKRHQIHHVLSPAPHHT